MLGVAPKFPRPGFVSKSCMPRRLASRRNGARRRYGGRGTYNGGDAIASACCAFKRELDGVMTRAAQVIIAGAWQFTTHSTGSDHPLHSENRRLILPVGLLLLRNRFLNLVLKLIQALGLVLERVQAQKGFFEH